MDKSFKTFLKHTAKDYYNQSVNPPVVRASTIIFKSMNELRKTQSKGKKNPIGGHFEYGRQGTSTTYILQQMLKRMEECYHVFLTPTGFGSVFLSIFSIVRPGDEILAADPVYSPTRLLTEDFLKSFNIKTVFYNPNDLNTLKKKITKKTKLIYVENPGSNSFEFQDLSKIISIPKKNKLFSVIDNTNFCIAFNSEALLLLAEPFFKRDFASLLLILILFITERDITLSFSAKSIPLIPLDDLPLNILNFFDINLIHFPNLVLNIIS